MCQVIVKLIKEIRSQGKSPKYVRCDNAGENHLISQQLINHELEGVEMEFTSPHTPQQNGIVERDFAFLYGRVRAMLNQAELTWTMREKMWAE